MHSERLLSTGEAGRMLGVSARRMAQMAASGEIEATKTEGGHYRIPLSAVEAELQRRRLGFMRLLALEPLLSLQEGMASTEPFQTASGGLERRLGRLEGQIEALREERDRLLTDLDAERQKSARLEAEIERLKNQ